MFPQVVFVTVLVRLFGLVQGQGQPFNLLASYNYSLDLVLVRIYILCFPVQVSVLSSWE